MLIFPFENLTCAGYICISDINYQLATCTIVALVPTTPFVFKFVFTNIISSNVVGVSGPSDGGVLGDPGDVVPEAGELEKEEDESYC